MSRRSRTLVERGLDSPESLEPDEVREVCLSASRQCILLDKIAYLDLEDPNLAVKLRAVLLARRTKTGD